MTRPSRRRHRNETFPSAFRVAYRVVVFVVLIVFVVPMWRCFPPGGINSARNMRARLEARAIATASLLYVHDHGRLPVPLDWENLGSDQPRPNPGDSSRVRANRESEWSRFAEHVIQVLTAAPNEAFEDPAWHDLNPGGIVYLSLDAPMALDPWGGTYAIQFRVRNTENTEDLLQKVQVVVRSAGPSRRFDDPAASAEKHDDITNLTW